MTPEEFETLQVQMYERSHTADGEAERLYCQMMYDGGLSIISKIHDRMDTAKTEFRTGARTVSGMADAMTDVTIATEKTICAIITSWVTITAPPDARAEGIDLMINQLKERIPEIMAELDQKLTTESKNNGGAAQTH